MVVSNDPAGHPPVEEHQATNSHEPQATDPAEPDGILLDTPPDPWSKSPLLSAPKGEHVGKEFDPVTPTVHSSVATGRPRRMPAPQRHYCYDLRGVRMAAGCN